MMRVALVLSLFIAAHAGHAPYLGGDIQELMEATKVAAPGSSPKPAVNKPVTEKQRRDSSTYNAKFADIAKAYAEGYKAAIKAVQARAFIAKRRLLGIKPNSNVPGLAYRNPYLEKVAKSIIPGTGMLHPNSVKMPEARFGKSTIPIPDDVHTQFSSTTRGSVTSTNDEKAGIVTKSTIPAAPEEVPKEKKSDIPFSGTFNPPVPFTDSKDAEVEKSTIPSAPSSEASHQISERSTPSHKDFIREDHPAFVKKPVLMWSEEERNKIAKLNARARHRNVYFDGAGGDPFRGGGVLSYQNAVNKKHRRRRRSADSEYEYHNKEQNQGYVYSTEHFVENHHPERERRSIHNDDIYYEPAYEQRPSYNTHAHVRHRRSHMPYLGQNLDALGVIRAVPRSWGNPQKKSVQPRRQEARMPPAPEATAAYYQPIPMDPARFNQFMAPAYRGTIPQPVSMPTMPAMMSPPLAMNYAAMFANPQPPPNFEQFRNVIPGYPAFMPGPLGYLPGPMPAGITSENIPSAETRSDDSNIIVKKDMIPHPPEQAEANT